MPAIEKKQPGQRGDSSKSEMTHRMKTRPFVFFGTIFILVIVVIAFVFVPAMAPQGGGIEDFTFGYYNRVPIRMVSGNFFHQMQQGFTRQHQHLLNENPDNMGLIQEIWAHAFVETVIYMGIQDTMRRAGYVVPSNVVDREVARQFQTMDGRFDAAAYRALDNATRMNMWRQAQESIAVGRYLSDLEGLRISSNEVSFISSMASPRRSFSAAIFPLASYPDSEVIAHAQANPAPFRVTRLSRIIVNSEWEAQQILNSIRDGDVTFEEAARINSVDMFADMGGEMGIRMAHELIAEIWDEQQRESVINLASGELSDVVTVSRGWAGTAWAFFRAEESVQPPDTGDPAQLERIRNHIMVNLRGTVEDWVIAEAASFAAQVRERDFEEVAAEGNILRRNFCPIPLNFGDSILLRTVSGAGIPELQHAGRDQFFWRAAFATPLMTPSNPVVVGNNVLVLFPLEESYEYEDFTDAIESFYVSRVRDNTHMMSRNYFLTSDRFDNRFNETFGRLWGAH